MKHYPDSWLPAMFGVLLLPSIGACQRVKPLGSICAPSQRIAGFDLNHCGHDAIISRNLDMSSSSLSNAGTSCKSGKAKAYHR